MSESMAKELSALIRQTMDQSYRCGLTRAIDIVSDRLMRCMAVEGRDGVVVWDTLGTELREIKHALERERDGEEVRGG